MQEQNTADQQPTNPQGSAGQTARVVGIAAATVLLGGSALFAGMRIARAAGAAADTAHIARGVQIANVPVGGLTREEARQKIRTWAITQSAKAITFAAPVSDRKWNYTLADVGGRFDLDGAVDQALKLGKEETLWEHLVHGGQERTENLKPAFKLSEPMLDRRLTAIAKITDCPAVNARAKVDEKGNILLAAQEQKGLALDIEATRKSLLKNGMEPLRDGATTNLVVKETLPTVSAADLGKMGTQLAAFHTDYGSSSSNRRHNIELAASHINGTLLAPGEVFSYNKTVGPRTPKLGFLDAPTYQDGQVVPGPGGGICQVSTTLYNTVLRANMKIVERSHHSMPVHYVPVGCDATVAYDDIDFKFQNSTEGPVVVLARTKGGELSFHLFGTQPADKRSVRIVSGDHRGNKDGGVTVTTYRVVKDETGVETREVLSTDSYRPMVSSSAAHKKKPVAVKRPTPVSAPTVVPVSAPAPAPTSPAHEPV